MSRSTGQDEYTERYEDPMEGQVAALARKREQKNGNRLISECDHRVRDHIQPQDRGIPQIARPMRHEITGKQLPKKLYHVAPPGMSGRK